MLTRYAKKLEALRQANLYRKRNVFDGPQSPETTINGAPYLLFASNSYLGLNNDAAIRARAMNALERFGAGAGGSRLTTGTSALHVELESMLASFKGSEAALVFSSGYTANVGLLSALCGAGDVIYSDALNHASIIDGCRLSKATIIPFAHNDMADLHRTIVQRGGQPGIIVTEGVFSMDGDMAPLPELLRISQENGLLLVVDDAHGTGTVGKTGRGSLEYFGLPFEDHLVVVGTLSKALASEGGFVCGSAVLCEYLRNTARSHIFSTALSPVAVAAALGAIEHIQGNAGVVQTLQDNVRYFCELLEGIGLPSHSATAIQPVHVGEEGAAVGASEALLGKGVFVPCIRYPTVKKGEARLRFSLMASHTHTQMEYAVSCLADVPGLGRT